MAWRPRFSEVQEKMDLLASAEAAGGVGGYKNLWLRQLSEENKYRGLTLVKIMRRKALCCIKRAQWMGRRGPKVVNTRDKQPMKPYSFYSKVSFNKKWEANKWCFICIAEFWPRKATNHRAKEMEHIAQCRISCPSGQREQGWCIPCTVTRKPSHHHRGRKDKRVNTRGAMLQTLLNLGLVRF